MRDQYLRPLIEAGGRVIVYHNLVQNFFKTPDRWEWPFKRNHRKIIVIDHREAFCGGMNLSSDYAGTLLEDLLFFHFEC